MGKYEARRPTGERPLLVLGISDVIVLEGPVDVPVTEHHVSAWGRWVRDVTIPDVAAERIRELGEHFEIVWASEWGHNAHTAFRPALGLPEEPWPFLPVQFDKLATIRAYARGLPWVWVDGPVVDLHDPGDVADGVIVRVDPRSGIAGIDVGELVRSASAIEATDTIGSMSATGEERHE
jgi:hypothetical protein